MITHIGTHSAESRAKMEAHIRGSYRTEADTRSACSDPYSESDSLQRENKHPCSIPCAFCIEAASRESGSSLPDVH